MRRTQDGREVARRIHDHIRAEWQARHVRYLGEGRGIELVSAIFGLCWLSLALPGDTFLLSPVYAPLVILTPLGISPETFWGGVLGVVGAIQGAGLAFNYRPVRKVGALLAFAFYAALALMLALGSLDGLSWRLHLAICLVNLWALFRLR